MKRFAIPVAALAAMLASAISIGSPGTKAGTPTPQGLFGSEAGSTPRVLPQRAYRESARGVRLNREKLRRGTFFVDLPGDVSFEAVRELQHEMTGDRFAWVGHARGNPKNRAVLGVSGDAVAGTFAYGGRLFKLEPRANGTHVVSEVSPRDPAPEGDPVPVFDPAAFDLPGQGSAAVAASDAGGAVIDVMVAYTPAVLAIYGEQGIEALVIQAVAETNQGYANSGMSTRLNLVGTVLTDYTTSGDMLTDLGRLRHTSDGHMDELHALRDELGADLVSLIDKQSGYCGLAYRMTGLSPFFASSAFSVVNHSCATGYFSFGHELGHNQGVHHDLEAAAGSSAIFPYAFGYQDPLGDFRTIMAYNCPGGCVRINHFSNPDVLFNGEPTGVASQSDNARAIDETAAVVANFRQSAAVAEPPARPTDLTAEVLADNSIALSWFDNAGDESGYYLERATGESPFSQIASLPADAAAFTDTGLEPGATYTYRVRAWSDSGLSGFSNTASGWIEQVSFVDQFPVYGGGWTHATGDWSDSGATDGRVLTLEELSADDYNWLAASLMEYYWVVDVQPGETVTIHTDAYTESLNQVFTFAYSTSLVRLGHAEDAWVNMFIVSPWFPGELKFTLPEGISGLVFISARDSNRVKNVGTRDRLHIDSLYIRTENPTGPIAP
jgi:hypothetical protein